METSQSNRVSPSSEVTPDAVIQKSDDLGFVAEAKASLPREPRYWTDDAEQLHKYDDDLHGWWTTDGLIGENDIVLLMRTPHADDFAEYVHKFNSKRGWTFQRNVCFVEFDRSGRVRQAIHLRRHKGDLADGELAERLRKGVMVPIEGLLDTFRSRKFYDAKPPIEYLMEVLWQDIFNEMKSQTEFDDELSCWPLEVTVPDLTLDLQRMFGSSGGLDREAEYPRQRWVRQALEALVDIGLAHRTDGPNYRILFRRLRGEVIETFSRHRVSERPEAQPPITQLSLLDE